MHPHPTCIIPSASCLQQRESKDTRLWMAAHRDRRKHVSQHHQATHAVTSASNAARARHTRGTDGRRLRGHCFVTQRCHLDFPQAVCTYLFSCCSALASSLRLRRAAASIRHDDRSPSERRRGAPTRFLNPLPVGQPAAPRPQKCCFGGGTARKCRRWATQLRPSDLGLGCMEQAAMRFRVQRAPWAANRMNREPR